MAVGVGHLIKNESESHAAIGQKMKRKGQRGAEETRIHKRQEIHLYSRDCSAHYQRFILVPHALNFSSSLSVRVLRAHVTAETTDPYFLSFLFALTLLAIPTTAGSLFTLPWKLVLPSLFDFSLVRRS